MTFRIYSTGFICMSVCASKDMTREGVEEQANIESPTGISSGWKISEDTTFADGHPMPCPCENDPDCQHWLLNC